MKKKFVLEICNENGECILSSDIITPESLLGALALCPDGGKVVITNIIVNDGK